MQKPFTIKDCMRHNPLTIHGDLNLVQAIELISEHKLTGLSASNNEGLVIGTLSELDCIQGVLTAIYNDYDPELVLVRNAMDNEPLTCQPNDNIIDIAQSMLKTRQRRRAVVDDGKLVGQVSSNNILWALMEHSRRKVLNKGK